MSQPLTDDEDELQVAKLLSTEVRADEDSHVELVRALRNSLREKRAADEAATRRVKQRRSGSHVGPSVVIDVCSSDDDAPPAMSVARLTSGASAGSRGKGLAGNASVPGVVQSLCTSDEESPPRSAQQQVAATGGLAAAGSSTSSSSKSGAARGSAGSSTAIVPWVAPVSRPAPCHVAWGKQMCIAGDATQLVPIEE
jgi:hypothetical protein